MEKKQYMTPAVEIFNMDSVQLLAGSGESTGGSDNTGSSQSREFDSDTRPVFNSVFGGDDE